MNASPNNPNAPDPLAVALSKLDPAPHGFDWNALMFAAGRASKTRALTFWKAAAGVCALVAAGFAVAFFTRPQVATERERVIYVERAPEKPADPPPPVAAVPVPEPAPGAKPAPESVARSAPRRSRAPRCAGSRCATRCCPWA
jgi:hypothetical protein